MLDTDYRRVREKSQTSDCFNNTRKPLTSILVKPAGPDCNMACKYCFYLEKGKLFSDVKIHRMSEAILEETIRQGMTQAENTISFGWQGGEPTLMGVSFFEKVIELQKRYGRGQTVGNGLQTNGILIDELWAKFLQKYNFLVGLSLDGPEHVHDHYRLMRRGQGSWSRVVDSAKRLLDAGVAVNALTVVNDYSVEFPQEIYEFHKALGLTYMQFIPCVETDSKDPRRIASYSVSAKKYGQFLITLFDLWMRDFVDNQPKTSIRFFDSVFYNYVDLSPPECTLLSVCGVYVVVEHNGDVYSCDFFVEPDWKLGNVMEENLSDMLNSERQYEFGQMKARIPQDCEHCAWLKYCRGGCPKDRIRDPHDRGLNHFCQSYRMFFEHADLRLRQLAQNWKLQQAQAAERGALLKEINRKETRVGRNDPCPCGSGRKFKKCCGLYL